MLDFELDPQFCPLTASVRSEYCLLVEGQILALDRACPYRERCCQQLNDLAAVYQQSKEIPES